MISTRDILNVPILIAPSAEFIPHISLLFALSPKSQKSCLFAKAKGLKKPNNQTPMNTNLSLHSLEQFLPSSSYAIKT